jgi:hypothetical protein
VRKAFWRVIWISRREVIAHYARSCVTEDDFIVGPEEWSESHVFPTSTINLKTNDYYRTYTENGTFDFLCVRLIQLY